MDERADTNAGDIEKVLTPRGEQLYGNRSMPGACVRPPDTRLTRYPLFPFSTSH